MPLNRSPAADQPAGRHLPGIVRTVPFSTAGDLGGLLEAYTEVAKRLGIMSENERPQGTGPVLVKG